MARPGKAAEAFLLVVAGAAVCALSATAQTNAASPTLHVTTRLVIINIAVHARKGVSAAGLTRDDFTVLDDGEKQPTSVFSVEPGSSLEALAPPLPPNVFSNHTGTGAGASVVLFDALDTDWIDSYFAREQLIQFVRTLPARAPVAIYELGPQGLEILRPLGARHPLLLDSAGGSRAGPVADRAGSGRGAVSTLRVRGEPVAAARLEVELRTFPPYPHFHGPSMSPLQAMGVIARQLSGLPGRKSLIWIADDVPFPGPQALSVNFALGRGPRGFINYPDPTPMMRRVRAAIQELNDADVAFCPVDAHGLETSGPDYQVLPMGYWAQHTGGRAYYFSNGLAQEVRDAVEYSGLTYTLGYYPRGVSWNGQYRHIRVSVDRNGLRLGYRRGYHAIDKPPAGHENALPILESAADSTLDLSGLGVTVRVDPGVNSAARRFTAVVYIDGRGLAFRPDHGRYHVSFAVFAGQFSRQGVLIAGKSKTVSFELSEAEYRAALSGGVGVTLREAAKPGAWLLRVAARDAASGAIGSVAIPLYRVLASGARSMAEP